MTLDESGTRTQKSQSIQNTVRHFYDTFGWLERDGKSGEDRSFRTFTAAYAAYHECTLKRTIACFSRLNGKLLLAGGGDIPESHSRVAQQFSSVWCIDISKKALDISRAKFEQRANYVLGSILDIPSTANHFDAILCAHVIYHIDINLQERAINELIRVTKPGGRVVVIYSNPRSFVRTVVRIKRAAAKLWGRRGDSQGQQRDARLRPQLPFALHPLKWWNQFEAQCTVTVLPWDVMGSDQERVLLTSERLAKCVYQTCSWVERTTPNIAARWWQYPMIVLDKRPRG